MPEGESLFCDVLISGSGIAGLRAALEAKAAGLSVIVVSKGPAGRQNSSFYAGGLLRPDPEEVKSVSGYETGIQKYLYEPELLPLLSGPAARREVESLISLGVPLEKHGKEYTPGSGEKSGPGGSAIMLPMLRKAMDMGITVLGNKIVTELLLSQGQVKGALAMDEKGKLLQVSAKAVVLATGGGAGIFEHNTNPPGITGDGYVLALRAGAILENMEYIHFYPVGLVGFSFPHQRASPALLRNEGAVLVNGKGEDLVEKSLKMPLGRAIVIPTVRFEMLTRIIAKENSNGGAFLDLTGISPSSWENILSSPWNKAFVDRAPLDLRKEKCPVIPLAHTFLGGVKIDTTGQTSVPGLFAAGEVAGGAYCGEEGASQLCRCLVMGALAGRNAARLAQGMRSMRTKEQEWLPATSRVLAFVGRSWTESAEEVRRSISRLVYAAMGPIREENTMQKTLKDLEAVDRRINSIKIEKPSHLQIALEAQNMSILAKALLGTALRRKESRGPHFRSDFPNRDDSWFKRIFISMDEKSQLKFSEQEITARS